MGQEDGILRADSDEWFPFARDDKAKGGGWFPSARDINGRDKS